MTLQESLDGPNERALGSPKHLVVPRLSFVLSTLDRTGLDNGVQRVL